MKLHSNVIDRSDLQAACVVARKEHGQDIMIAESAVCGSRKRARGIQFYCESLNGKRSSNRNDGTKAASWEAWGYVIAALFNRDPEAIIGHYADPDDFRAQCERYQPNGAATDFLDTLEA